MTNYSKTLRYSNKEYPQLLKQIYNPPKKLFYRGILQVLEKPCVAVVGTRRPTDYGEYIAEKIVKELSILDIAIVSGLAKGIDTIAHKTALECGLSTIAILGSGIENIYPPANYELAKLIEENGLIISEFEGDTEPVNFHFPMRNRIISGLSLATIVVEAPEKSGALITANYALDQGREIFVIPGDIDREQSAGILKLLQKGAAYPVSSGYEIIDLLKKQPHLFKENKNSTKTPFTVLSSSLGRTNRLVSGTFAESSGIKKSKILPEIANNLTPDQKKILLSTSKHRPHSLENIQEKTSLSPSTILANLSILEIKKFIKIMNGKYLRT